MRKDTTFSNRKLSRAEFSKKYWLDGRLPYQYHTAEIEDGRDEREQFVFNNVRALWERMNGHSEYIHHDIGGVKDRLDTVEKKNKRMTIMITTLLLSSILRQLGGKS